MRACVCVYVSADGKISVEDFRRLIREMQMRGDEGDRSDEGKKTLLGLTHTQCPHPAL